MTEIKAPAPGDAPSGLPPLPPIDTSLSERVLQLARENERLRGLLDAAAAALPTATVCNDYNADGKSARIDTYLPAGTDLYTRPQAPAVGAQDSRAAFEEQWRQNPTANKVAALAWWYAGAAHACRVPLDDEVIDAAWRTEKAADGTWVGYGCNLVGFASAVRWTERRHRIGTDSDVPVQGSQP